MHCRLVHGAATYGGKLNRTSLRRCVTMVQRLLTALLPVWIGRGAGEDGGPCAIRRWGLCGKWQLMAGAGRGARGRVQILFPKTAPLFGWSRYRASV